MPDVNTASVMTAFDVLGRGLHHKPACLYIQNIQGGYVGRGVADCDCGTAEARATFEQIVKELRDTCQEYPSYEEFDPIRLMVGLPLWRDGAGR